MEVLLDEILQDLKLQLDISSEQEVALLSSKIKNAIREVKRARNYPKYYTDAQIAEDLEDRKMNYNAYPNMEDYYSNIINLALYDYSQIGGEGELSHSDSGTSRTWKDRKECFNGISTICQYGG